MDKSEKLTAALAGAVLLLILTVAVAINWYRAGVQAEVYRRQGTSMSTWEVFLGAKPVERPVPGISR